MKQIFQFHLKLFSNFKKNYKYFLTFLDYINFHVSKMILTFFSVTVKIYYMSIISKKYWRNVSNLPFNLSILIILKVRYNQKQIGAPYILPKNEQTNLFVFFCHDSPKIRFLGESTAYQSAYGLIWPLGWINFNFYYFSDLA